MCVAQLGLNLWKPKNRFLGIPAMISSYFADLSWSKLSGSIVIVFENAVAPQIRRPWLLLAVVSGRHLVGNSGSRRPLLLECHGITRLLRLAGRLS